MIFYLFTRLNIIKLNNLLYFKRIKMSSFAERKKYIENNKDKLSSFANEICKGNSSKEYSSFCNSAKTLKELGNNISVLSIHQIDLLYEYLTEKR